MIRLCNNILVYSRSTTEILLGDIHIKGRHARKNKYGKVVTEKKGSLEHCFI